VHAALRNQRVRKGERERKEEFSGFIRLCADVLDKNSKKK